MSADQERYSVDIAIDLYRRCDLLQEVIDRRASLSATDLRGYLKIMREAYTALYHVLTAPEREELREALKAKTD